MDCWVEILCVRNRGRRILLTGGLRVGNWWTSGSRLMNLDIAKMSPKRVDREFIASL